MWQTPKAGEVGGAGGGAGWELSAKAAVYALCEAAREALERLAAGLLLEEPMEADAEQIDGEAEPEEPIEAAEAGEEEEESSEGSFADVNTLSEVVRVSADSE